MTETPNEQPDPGTDPAVTAPSDSTAASDPAEGEHVAEAAQPTGDEPTTSGADVPVAIDPSLQQSNPGSDISEAKAAGLPTPEPSESDLEWRQSHGIVDNTVDRSADNESSETTPDDDNAEADGRHSAPSE